MPSFHEYTDMKEIIVSENNDIYVLGWGTQMCDVGTFSDFFISKYDSNGNELWTRTWAEQNWFDFSLKGLKMIGSGNLSLSFTDNINNPNETRIYSINGTGSLIDSLIVSKPLLDGIDSLVGFNRIGFQQDSLFGFDNSGNTSVSRSFSSDIQDIQVLNDSLYVLTIDSIYVFDSGFQLINGTDLVGYSKYSHLSVSTTNVEFASNSGASLSIHVLDHNLQVVSTETIALQLTTEDHFNYNDEHISIVRLHDLTSYTAIRYLDYSRNSSQNTVVNTTDIGVIDLVATQTEVTYAGNPGVYTIKIWADALVKNYGDNILDACRINHVVSPWGICNASVYTEQFSNLNLQPNDSAWISLGLIHYDTEFFGDTISWDVCAYTSHPNYVSDLNVPNDDYCELFILGYVGMNELDLNSKKLVRVIDLMGRETEDKPNTVLIYIYSDGTTEKVFRVE